MPHDFKLPRKVRTFYLNISNRLTANQLQRNPIKIRFFFSCFSLYKIKFSKFFTFKSYQAVKDIFLTKGNIISKAKEINKKLIIFFHSHWTFMIHKRNIRRSNISIHIGNFFELFRHNNKFVYLLCVKYSLFLDCLMLNTPKTNFGIL